MPLNKSSRTGVPGLETIYAPQYLSTTLGMFILVFLVAFEAMAVTTVTARYVWFAILQS